MQWLRNYTGSEAAADGLAAVIVTVMLIPQSLAYAMLAGLPAEFGLYASMLPLVAYALLGSSSSLAVGPVAITSLMTAAVVGEIAQSGSEQYIEAAILLAAICGLVLLLMGLLRLGWIANLLSHSVVSGFITAAGILIAASQMKHILGIPMNGGNLIELGVSAANNIQETNGYASSIGISSLLILVLVRSYLRPVLHHFRWSPMWIGMTTKMGPVITIVVSALIVGHYNFDEKGLAVIGEIPAGLPPFSLPNISTDLFSQLLPAALLISLIGFVESVSVAQTLAARRRQRIDPNRELLGLGFANIAASVSSSYPVMGGFARSVVNFDAGAATRMAGIITAGYIALIAVFFTHWLHYLPNSTLAAAIIVSVSSLIDFKQVRKTWQYSYADFAAMFTTIVVVLMVGVAMGLLCGLITSLILHLWRTSRPNIAEVGLVEGTEQFRSVLRYEVLAQDTVFSVRVDESLYFINMPYLEDYIYNSVISGSKIKHVVLVCSAVNHIDYSAIECLISLNRRLDNAGVKFHLSEVKGPVFDRLNRSDFLSGVTGNIFDSQYDAFCALR
ncbi:MAG: SulP family sulfate permease [Gammaproteobacteria bacterium]